MPRCSISRGQGHLCLPLEMRTAGFVHLLAGPWMPLFRKRGWCSWGFPWMCPPSFCTWKFYLNVTVWRIWDSGSLIGVSGATEAEWVWCVSDVSNLHGGSKHCAPTSTVFGFWQTWCHSATQRTPARTTVDKRMVRCLQQHLQRKDHIIIYWVVAFQRGIELLHVLWLLWLFTMTD